MLKRAFTMLELVFVIVVAGILAISIIPQLERDNIGEAAHQVARHIRLAQHHALVDDRFDGSLDWYRSMWQIAFRTTNFCYVVYRDVDKAGNADVVESAVDPLTKKRVYSNTSCSENPLYTDETLLWKKYGVDSISLTGCGSNSYIAFDHMGRPHQDLTSATNFLQSNCLINIGTNDGKSATITIYQDTGFVKVTTIDGVTMP